MVVRRTRKDVEDARASRTSYTQWEEGWGQGKDGDRRYESSTMPEGGRKLDAERGRAGTLGLGAGGQWIIGERDGHCRRVQ